MLKKLRLKFICTNMLIVTVMLLVIFGMVFHFTRERLEAESIQMMHAIADRPLYQGSPTEHANGVRLPYFTIQLSPWGDLIATGGGYYDLSDTDFLLEVTEAALQAPENTGILEAYKLRYLRVLSPGSSCLVFADITSERATLTGLMQTCLWLGALSLLVFFGVSLLLARWAVKPVAQAWKQQQQFVADASHELKTPLTVIMTSAELLQDPDCQEQTKRRSTESILTMTRQMRTLVNGLLELARADNGTTQLHFAPLDFSRLVSDSLLPFEPMFFEAGLTLHSQIQPELTVSGSESHLQQVLDILLDNARKYAAPDTWAAVSLSRHGNSGLLAVSTPGIALSREDLKNIFKRFYRVDSARSDSTSHGLGLSIAEQLVNSHGGKIWAESRDGVNTFFVSVPLILIE